MSSRGTIGVAAVAALAFAGLSRAQDAGAGAQLKVTMQGLRTDRGRLSCLLFDHADGFPSEPARAVQVQQTSVKGGTATCVFALPTVPARYAVAFFHDENDNGRLDTGLFGIPKEGYGASRDAARGRLGPATFSDASFASNGTSQELTLEPVYR